jgi:hypothetical protein
MTKANKAPAMTHQNAAPASHPAMENSRPNAASVACMTLARR